jgi:hypothetical protein
MSTTFTWNVIQLEREIFDGYVYTVHYTVTAKDDVYCAVVFDSLDLKRPESDLIPFADLTEEVVVGWVKEKFGAEKVQEILDALQAQLDEQRTPTKAAGLPWAG